MTDICNILRRDFEMRRASNPRLSMRAYAKFLDYDASTVAKIISGRRQPGLKAAKHLAQRIGWTQNSSDQQSSFESDFFNISADHFKLIADWYHFGIIEAMNLDNFKAEPTWIARRLGISVHDVRAAIGRLQRVGILRIDAKNTWTLETGATHSTLGIKGTTGALKQMQRQILLKALAALDEVPVDKRNQSSMTMAIDSTKLVEAAEKIKSFRRSLSKFLESGSKKDAVYLLSISLFPTRST